MSTREWNRLKRQGESIALSLKSKGYNCVKKPKQLLWYIQSPTPGSQIYGLAWLTPPVNDWVVIPDVESDEKIKLQKLVNQHLQRSSGR